MYNNEQKQRYIDSLVIDGADRQKIKRTSLLFARIEENEIMAEADVSHMDFEYAQALLRSPGVLRPSVFYTSITIIRDYIRWCITEGLAEPSSPALRVVPEGLEETRNSMVSGDIGLAAVLDKACDGVEKGTSDILLRGFAWLMFSGVHFEDANKLTAEDFLPDVPAVKSGGRVLVLSPYAVPAIRFLAESDSFAVNHPQYKIRKRMEGTQLMRGTIGVVEPKSAAGRLQKRFNDAKAAGKCSVTLTATNIGKSGLFSTMHEIELGGFEPDFAVNVGEFMAYQTDKRGKPYTSNGADATVVRRRSLMTSFLEAYSRWKLAFTPS